MGTNEIKLIEELAGNLQEWADNPSYTHSPTFIRFAPDFGQKEVILWLLAENPMLGQKVQEDFKSLQEKVDNLNSLSAKPITEDESHEFCAYVDEVKGIAYGLVETLRTITRLIKKRGIIKKTLKIIGTIVVSIISSLIAAILIDILGDFGWIVKIKTIIYHIQTPK